MSLEVQSILNQNITVVFHSLDLQDINSAALKTLQGKRTRATVMDTPEMIVAVYPPDPTIIQIDNRRVRVSLPKNSEVLGQIPLWQLAVRASELVAEESSPIAFGFNYDLGILLPEVDVSDFFIQRFIREPESLNQMLDGTLVSAVPRFRYVRDETRYDLILEPLNTARIKVHLNVHFELGGHPMPSSSELHHRYVEEYDRLINMLPRVLEAERK